MSNTHVIVEMCPAHPAEEPTKTVTLNGVYEYIDLTDDDQLLVSAEDGTYLLDLDAALDHVKVML